MTITQPLAPPHARLPFEETVIDLIRARHPVLLVETHEQDRVVAALERVGSSPDLRRPRGVKIYTLTQGLRAVGAQGKPQTADAALAAATAETEPSIFVFNDLHHALGAGNGRAEPALIRALLDTATAFRTGPVPHTLVLVVPALTLPVDLEKVVTVVDLPLPGRDEIDAVLQEIVVANAASITVRLDAVERERLLRAAQGLTLAEAENAFARAIAKDRVLDAADIALVLEEKRQTIRKSGLLEYIATSGDLNEVGGLENLKTWLNRRDGSWAGEAEQWGVPAPKGVLITGVPGCGKSLTATSMAAAWRLPLLRLDVGKVFSGLVGSSESNMRATLRLAEAVAPCVLWIDEIEKGFGGSGGSGDSGTGLRVFGTFLTWMQEKTEPVFVVATANKIDGLPPEFLRKGRFDEIFFVDLPTSAERKTIWKLHLERSLARGPALTGEVRAEQSDIEVLAELSEGFSGAEIAEAVVAACFEAFAERRRLRRSDLERAVRNTVPLSVTQAEQIRAIRDWASTRAVAATSQQDRAEYVERAATPAGDVASWRGGRTIDF